MTEESTAGHRLRAARLAADLSQEDLAHLASCSAWTVHRLENGWHEPRASTARRLAKALGTTAKELFGEEN